jgi:hypothetical protein
MLNDLLCHPMCSLRIVNEIPVGICMTWVCKQPSPPYGILLPYYFLTAETQEILPYASVGDTSTVIGPACLLQLSSSDRKHSQAIGVYSGPHQELQAFSEVL